MQMKVELKVTKVDLGASHFVVPIGANWASGSRSVLFPRDEWTGLPPWYGSRLQQMTEMYDSLSGHGENLGARHIGDPIGANWAKWLSFCALSWQMNLPLSSTRLTIYSDAIWPRFRILFIALGFCDVYDLAKENTPWMLGCLEAQWHGLCRWIWSTFLWIYLLILNATLREVFTICWCWWLFSLLLLLLSSTPLIGSSLAWLHQ